MARLMTKLAGWASAAAVSLFAGAAQAQEFSIGDRLVEILKGNWQPVFYLIVAASFVLGLFILTRGLVKLKDASLDGGRGTAAEGMLHILAATLLIGLPQVAGIGVTTITGVDASIFGSQGEMASISESLDLDGGSSLGLSGSGTINDILQFAGNMPAAPENCYQSSEPPVCMVQNIARNAAPMGIVTVFALTFLGGLWSFASAIGDLAKSHANGGRLPQGWSAKLVIAVLMMNSPWLFYTAANTILGVSTVTDQAFEVSSSLLSYTFSSTGASGRASEFFSKYQAVIGHALVILAFFGVWAFVRGLAMIKATAEGKSQGTYMMGAVFMVAGVLLTNAKVSTCAVLYTVGGSGMTFGFCN